MDDKNCDQTSELPTFGPIRQWKLVIRAANQEKRRTLRPGMSLTLGTSETVDIQLCDPTVSAEHCLIRAESDGVRVVDRGSKNGTYVGPGRISNVLLQGPCAGFSIGRTSVELCEHRTSQDGDDLGLIGDSPAMVRLREQIRAFAPLKKPVLILGESGTGKDLVARALHAHSGRRGDYVETNVAAFPDSLLDAELFGYERGAFTGAVMNRRGLFEEAHEGTLFLDEIAELSRAGQAKLLRVVEDGNIRSLGKSGKKHVEVRLISATCSDLNRMISDGGFRPDLFHRISLLTLNIPPLRNRLGDIEVLARHFLNTVVDEVGGRYLLPATVELLRSHTFPGNVRELFAALYRAAVLSPREEIAPGALQLGSSADVAPRKSRLYPEQAAQLLSVHESVSAAARAAGVPRSTFRSVLKRVKAS